MRSMDALKIGTHEVLTEILLDAGTVEAPLGGRQARLVCSESRTFMIYGAA